MVAESVMFITVLAMCRQCTELSIEDGFLGLRSLLLSSPDRLPTSRFRAVCLREDLVTSAPNVALS